jgi:hypothetical protein
MKRTVIYNVYAQVLPNFEGAGYEYELRGTFKNEREANSLQRRLIRDGYVTSIEKKYEYEEQEQAPRVVAPRVQALPLPPPQQPYSSFPRPRYQEPIYVSREELRRREASKIEQLRRRKAVQIEEKRKEQFQQKWWEARIEQARKKKLQDQQKTRKKKQEEQKARKLRQEPEYPTFDGRWIRSLLKKPPQSKKEKQAYEQHSYEQPPPYDSYEQPPPYDSRMDAGPQAQLSYNPPENSGLLSFLF